MNIFIIIFYRNYVHIFFLIFSKYFNIFLSIYLYILLIIIIYIIKYYIYIFCLIKVLSILIHPHIILEFVYNIFFLHDKSPILNYQ